MMSMIQVDHLTKDYGQHKGVFDVSFQIHQGEVLGFLGPNGSGKTTTIRHLMGFIKPDSGYVSIDGMDCFHQSAAVLQKVGYLPGEIAFMEDMNAQEMIEFIAKMKGMNDLSYAYELISFLELDVKGKIKRMSKGMKQKIALIIALMQDPPVLILDEPTSGLDPLMQFKFIELIKKAKQQGKTIFMSSHIFEEIENVCDRVIMIKNGQIIAAEEMEKLKHHRVKRYDIHFHDLKEAQQFAMHHDQAKQHDHQVSLLVKGNVDPFIKEIAHYTIDDVSISSQTLEDIFLQYYGE